jgi:hypothetical protein
VLAVAAFAQGPQGDRDGVRDFAGPGQGLGNGHAYGFVGADGDGVSDRFVDADGDSVCDNVGLGLGYGRAGSDAPRGQGVGMMGRGYGMHGSNYDSRTEGNTDLDSSYITLSVFLSVRESKIWLRLGRSMIYSDRIDTSLSEKSM